MANNGLNIKVITICCGSRVGQHIFAVKHIQAFVLHRAHIKEVHRDHHVDVQIIFQIKTLLIPGHRPFQCVQRELTFMPLTFFNKQLQADITATAGNKIIR